MKDTIILFCFLLFSVDIQGQSNLVINPSFESFTLCPSSYSNNISCTTNWTSFRESPGYLNSCDGAGSYWSVPKHYFGYQAAASGNAYAGVTTFNYMPDKRDILGSKLSQTLNIGQEYFISLKVNLSELNAGAGPQWLPTNKIGVRFSTVPYSSLTPVPIDNFAHFFTDLVIRDTLNWTTLSGSFTADSNYKYIMIGNFFDDANTDTVRFHSSTWGYLYIDDVCVSTSSLMCDISTAIKKNTAEAKIEIYPNPASSTISILNSYIYNTSIKIVNTLGKEVLQRNIMADPAIDVSLLVNGIYFVYIYRDNTVWLKKIIIDH